MSRSLTIGSLLCLLLGAGPLWMADSPSTTQLKFQQYTRASLVLLCSCLFHWPGCAFAIWTCCKRKFFMPSIQKTLIDFQKSILRAPHSDLMDSSACHSATLAMDADLWRRSWKVSCEEFPAPSHAHLGKRGYRVVGFRDGHFRHGILEVAKERGSGCAAGFYRVVRGAEAFFRQAAGGLPTRRLKARLKAYSDS